MMRPVMDELGPPGSFRKKGENVFSREPRAARHDADFRVCRRKALHDAGETVPDCVRSAFSLKKTLASREKSVYDHPSDVRTGHLCTCL